MFKRIKEYFNSPLFPMWFRYFNLTLLLPILLWPFVFYLTIFFFDNPQDLKLTYILFFAVNAYPVYLLAIAYLNSKLYIFNKILGTILPSILVFTILISTSYLAYEIFRTQREAMIERDKRIERGDIGNGYIKRNGQIFKDDSLIIEADAQSFKLLSRDWARDKNMMFFHGKPVPIIDVNSFKLLDYHYSKDKNHVFYENEVIPEADPKTFYHINGTNDGRDKANCFRWGEKVDCVELLKEE